MQFCMQQMSWALQLQRLRPSVQWPGPPRAEKWGLSQEKRVSSRCAQSGSLDRHCRTSLCAHLQLPSATPPSLLQLSAHLRQHTSLSADQCDKPCLLSLGSGIGFKATAVASEVTYISSITGYHFCFDMRPGGYKIPCLGLVCPRWEEGLQQDIPAWLEQRLAGGLDT